MASLREPTEPRPATFAQLPTTTEWPLRSTRVVAPPPPLGVTVVQANSWMGALRRAVGEAALGMALSDPMVHGAYRRHLAEIPRDAD